MHGFNGKAFLLETPHIRQFTQMLAQQARAASGVMIGSTAVGILTGRLRRICILTRRNC